MSAAPTSAPESPRAVEGPFEAAPRSLRPPRQGCSRMALSGCAVLMLLVGLGVLTLMLKARDVVAWSLERVRVEIERTLPYDLPVAERERLAAGFAAVDARLERGELDAAGFQALQRQLLHFATLGRAPTRDEIAELAAALERFAGVTPVAPATGGDP